MNDFKVKWRASLSNGETHYEGKGDYTRVPGELSPWLRLQEYITDNGLTITSLALYDDKGRTFNLPSSGSRPKFKAFTDTLPPVDYDMFRAISQDLGQTDGENVELYDYVENQEHFTVVSALYSTYSLQLWVSELNPDHCWVLAVPR